MKLFVVVVVLLGGCATKQGCNLTCEDCGQIKLSCVDEGRDASLIFFPVLRGR